MFRLHGWPQMRQSTSSRQTIRQPSGPGTARFASGLSANDFLRRSSVVRFSKAGLEQVAGDVRLMAEKEGLTAHSFSVDVRLSASKHTTSEALTKSGR